MMAGGEAQTSPSVLPKNQKIKVTSIETTARGTAVLQDTSRFLCQQLRHYIISNLQYALSSIAQKGRWKITNC